MLVNGETFYHIRKNKNNDENSKLGSYIKIDNSFNTSLYLKLLKEEKDLLERFKSEVNITLKYYTKEDFDKIMDEYMKLDLDSKIQNMESLKARNLIKEESKKDFNELLIRYYLLRREKALEVGRKIFNSSAPSRNHSLVLINEEDLYYYIRKSGVKRYDLLLLEVYGNAFVTSDTLFPDVRLDFDKQVEDSKRYWQPKKMVIRKEILFQGKAKIIK